MSCMLQREKENVEQGVGQRKKQKSKGGGERGDM